MRSPFIVAGAVSLALSVLSSAGNPSDPILGTWQIQTLIQQSITIDDGTPPTNTIFEGDGPAIYTANHQVVWDTDYTGPWKKKSGLYKINLSNSYELTLEAQSPGASIDASVKFAKIKVIGPTQFGDIHVKLTAKAGGVTQKIVETGSLGGTLQ